MLNIIFKDNISECSYLSIASKGIRKFSTARPSVISLSHYFSPERRKVEEFIENIYAEKYEAKISSHYPILMSVRDIEDNIIAAIGFRYADEERLFLEQYLNEKIEDILGNKFKDKDINRGKIVEVGGLASKGNGASIFLFTALATYLKREGKEYVSVTATTFLRRYFAKIGLKLKFISKAENSKLIDNGASWGTYYATEPQVRAGTISSVCKLLKRKLKAELRDSDASYFARLHKKMEDYSI